VAQITTFDLVLGLISSEALQQAMIDGDDSMTNAFLVVTTLVGADILMSQWKQRSELVERVVDGAPVVRYAVVETRRDHLRRPEGAVRRLTAAPAERRTHPSFGPGDAPRGDTSVKQVRVADGHGRPAAEPRITGDDDGSGAH
jgi:hypothetical protein